MAPSRRRWSATPSKTSTINVCQQGETITVKAPPTASIMSCDGKNGAVDGVCGVSSKEALCN
eukprot:2123015-Pyramimonas_sp.AAC.1